MEWSTFAKKLSLSVLPLLVAATAGCSDDSDESQCDDADQDGYGVGSGCAGPDCDEADGSCHEGACCPLACPEPEFAEGPPGDNTADARRAYDAGTEMLFWRVVASPFTTPSEPDEGIGSDGVGIVDLDADGRADLVAVRNLKGRGRFTILFFRNLGCLSFERQVLVPPTNGRADVPTFVDFDDDGMLDMFVGANGRHRLYLARGSRTSFTDVAAQMGVTNDATYNHGHAGIADLDGDGWLDIATGANQIGNPDEGRSLRRMYIYRPPAAGGAWESGAFVDASTLPEGAIPELPTVSGAEIFPDLMMRRGPEGLETVTADSCDPDLDRSGAISLLRDLDDDGDLDLLQGSSNDMFMGTINGECPTGEWRFGVWAWESRMRQGSILYELLTEGGSSIADWGQMRYVHDPDPDLGYYEVDPEGPGSAFSPLSMNAADIDNDGDLDVIGLTPTDPESHVQSDLIAGRLWINEGGLAFREATSAVGLDALNFTYTELAEVWDVDFPDVLPLAEAACAASDWKPACEPMAGGDHQMMLGGGSIFADFNNDGWLDLHVVDRHDDPLDIIRNLLFLNQGDGTFRLLTTEQSGIDGTGISADARDLDGDGLLEIVVLERGQITGSDYPAADRVYWNTGGFGGKDNHWLEVRLEGLPARQLVGARLFLYDGSSLLGRRDLFPSTGTYKTSQDMLVHFGLGHRTSVELRIRPYSPTADVAEVVVSGFPVDGRIAVDMTDGSWRELP